MSLLSLSKKIISRGKVKRSTGLTPLWPLSKRGASSASGGGKKSKDNVKTPPTAGKSKKVTPKKGAASKPAVIPKLEAYMLLSEKSLTSQEQSTIVLRVPPHANKYQIAQVVKDKYGVVALDVRTAQFSGKGRRRGQTEGSTQAWKKAYVKVENIQALTTGP